MFRRRLSTALIATVAAPSKQTWMMKQYAMPDHVSEQQKRTFRTTPFALKEAEGYSGAADVNAKNNNNNKDRKASSSYTQQAKATQREDALKTIKTSSAAASVSSQSASFAAGDRSVDNDNKLRHEHASVSDENANAKTASGAGGAGGNAESNGNNSEANTATAAPNDVSYDAKMKTEAGSAQYAGASMTRIGGATASEAGAYARGYGGGDNSDVIGSGGPWGGGGGGGGMRPF